MTEDVNLIANKPMPKCQVKENSKFLNKKEANVFMIVKK